MDWSCLMWYFFPRSIYLKTRFLTQKNLKKFEVSCQAEIPKNKYKKKTSIPILKTQIRGRERLEGEKDSGRSDLGRPRPRRHRCASPRPGFARGLGWPRHTSPRPGLRVAWVCLGRVRWSKATNSDLDLLSLSVSGFFFFFSFFFFLWVLLWCSGGSSLICSYL